MTRRTQFAMSRIAAAMCFAASAATLAQPSPPQLVPAPAFGQPLSCGKGPALTFLGSRGLAGTPTSADATWAIAEMTRIGYPAALPADADAARAAAAVSGLLRRGSLVGAKMANDEARRQYPAFAASKFTQNFENLLTVLTQPVGHATYPEAVRADGERRPAGAHRHTHGVDLEDSSAALNEIIQRSAITAKALGPLYKRRAVLDYMLAQGFRDAIALPVAISSVCGDGLSAGDMKKVDISARFMAMPSKSSRNQE